jgi:hypothetical protein
MAAPMTKKSFKFEFEVTVEMDAVDAQQISTNELNPHLPQLKRLQQALLNDENELLHQMMITALDKLQIYVDYLASQDNLQALDKAAETLEAEDQDFFEQVGDDFADLTRAIRFSSLSAQLESSTVYENTSVEAGETNWQPFWSDLQWNSELGRLLAAYAAPAMIVDLSPEQTSNHQFLLRYLTEERDGIHMEANCTCGHTFFQVGEDEFQVLEALWHDYQQHYEAKNIAGQLLRNWMKARNNPMRRYYRS